MPESLSSDAAVKVAQAIRDRANPATQQDAMRQRDKWLFENDQGLLHLTAEVRKVLEEAQP
ncbi:MAG: hypothetical protein JSS57_00175 [Proteobacteria bacterium]|nr:hypothetical protein [Pseudomonadota bacterium]